MIAWRGVVTNDGKLWAWPMLMLDHNKAFQLFPALSDYRCRWRQWEPGGPVDFDPGCTAEDRARVNAWVDAAAGASR